jgi:hypothetical protein
VGRGDAVTAVGESLRFAVLDGGRELVDKMAAREMILRFVNGPMIAEACCTNRKWVVYADGGSRPFPSAHNVWSQSGPAADACVSP